MSPTTPFHGASQKGKSLPFWPKSNQNHQGLDGMEQEGKRWKGEQSRALSNIHGADRLKRSLRIP